MPLSEIFFTLFTSLAAADTIINKARKLVCSQARPEECEEIYRWLYDNLEIISKDDDQQDKAVLIIKQGLVDHSFVADPEINLASVMIKLARLSNGQ